MVKFRHFLLAAVAITVIACSNDYVHEHEMPEIDIPEMPPTATVSFTGDEKLVLMQMRNPGNRICIDEAAETALDAISFFSGTTTRSVAAQTIASITALRGEPATRTATRSADGNDVEIQFPDTLAFVFNFADDAGFAIVAADTRIESQILAFTDNGNFENAAEIPGVAIFLEGLDAYIEYSIIRAEHLRDSLMEGILAKVQEMMEERQENTTRLGCCCTTACSSCGWRPAPPGAMMVILPFSVHYGAWTTNVITPPLLPVEWGQGFPFNHQVPVLCPDPERPETGGRAPAGCVATATAQIMAFWRHPAQIDGFIPNWHILHMFTARPGKFPNVYGRQHLPIFGYTFSPNEQLFIDQVSQLMLRIGTNIGMSYSCGGSGALLEDAVMFLINSLGFTGGDRRRYNTDAVAESLNSGNPVPIEGYTALWEGHAWIIDGQLQQSRVVTTEYRIGWTNGWETVLMDPNCWCQWGGGVPIIAQRTELSSLYLHNNWGWGRARESSNDEAPDNANGFFVAGSFNVRNRRFHSDGTAGSGQNLPSHNFVHWLYIYPNLRR